MRYLSKVETWITNSIESDDRWSEIKPFLFVRLTTSDGIEGWGEAFTLPYREKAVNEIIHSLTKVFSLEGNLLPINFHKKSTSILDKHRGIDFAAATSAIEMGLWDIQGKLEGKPLSHLLSDNPKCLVPIYANTWSDKSPDYKSLGVRSSQLLKQGFGGIKIYPLQNRSVEEASKCVSYIRQIIGKKTPLMLDLASPDDPGLALNLAVLIKDNNPYWFEEPVDGEEVRMLASIRNKTGLKIVTGEKQSGIPHFREILAAGAADILNPDIAGVGGIIDMIEIANLAGKKDVLVSPHCWNSMSIAASAMLHFCSSNINTDMAEIYPEYIPHALKFSRLGFKIKDGYAKLDDRPGLGVEIDVPSLMPMCSDYNKSNLKI